MTPAELATPVEIADDHDLEVAVQRALDRAGVTLADLRRQAAQSRFTSERARQAWFMLSALAERF